jgi:anti-sigma regulatory factor (Ser/Thr protein kinase)
VPPVPDRVRVPLRDDLRAPAQARRAVRDVLLSWRLPELVDAVVLAVSELVTNALRHGRPPVHLVLHRERACVRLDVHDGRPPVPPSDRRPASDEAESGRGLQIVHALAVDVGCERVPGDGKVVHASFPTGPDREQ